MRPPLEATTPHWVEIADKTQFRKKIRLEIFMCVAGCLFFVFFVIDGGGGENTENVFECVFLIKLAKCCAGTKKLYKCRSFIRKGKGVSH